MRRHAYTVEYKMHEAADVKSVSFLAQNKEDAYFTALYAMIPNIEKRLPYSAWVSSVTYNNGNYKIFNNFEGKPY